MRTSLRNYFNFPTGCVELAKEWDVVIFAAMSADSAVATSIADDLGTLEIAAIEATDSARVEVWPVVGLSSFGYEFVVRVWAP